MESDADIVLSGKDSTLHGSESEEETGDNETNSSTSEITAKLHDFSLISPKPSACSLTNCLLDDDEFKLQCSTCNKLVHYGCTKLPAFQISHFLTKGYRRYVWKECTTVPKYIWENTMKSKHKIANSNDESLEERLEIMNNRITSLTNELKLKTIEFKECDVKYSKLEKNNQKLREMIKSMEKQKQGNKYIQCFSRRSGISTQTDDHNADAYAKLLVKTNLLEKNLEENKEKLEKQINENTKIKSTQVHSS